MVNLYFIGRWVHKNADAIGNLRDLINILTAKARANGMWLSSPFAIERLPPDSQRIDATQSERNAALTAGDVMLVVSVHVSPGVLLPEYISPEHFSAVCAVSDAIVEEYAGGKRLFALRSALKIYSILKARR